MFYEEGWVPLSEVTSEVFRRLQALKAAEKIGRGQGDLRSILALTVWDICDVASKIGVTGPDGSVVDASKDLVAWADPTKLSNEHVNVQLGTVGSSDLAGDDGKPPSAETMRSRYGPFLNLPVVIPTNNFQSSMSFLQEEVKDDLDGDTALMAGAKVILGMVESGELLTRDLARARVGNALSRRRFKLAWAIASKKVPELRKPNRWQGI